MERCPPLLLLWWLRCNNQVELRDHRGSSKRKATSLHILILACALAFVVPTKVCWWSMVNFNGWLPRQALMFPWLWHVLHAFLLHGICGNIDVYCKLTWCDLNLATSGHFFPPKTSFVWVASPFFGVTKLLKLSTKNADHKWEKNSKSFQIIIH